MKRIGKSHQSNKSRVKSKRRRVALPNEIWHECFTYLKTADHKKLSLTCRLFNDICLRLLFKSVHCSSHISLMQWEMPLSMEVKVDQLEKKMKSLKSLAQSTRHAQVVRELNVAYSLQASGCGEEAAAIGKESYTHFVDGLVQCLPLFVNLRVINVKEFRAKMDKKILVAMARHPSLDEVNLKSVRFGVHIVKPRIALRKLTISNDRRSDSNPNPSSKRLDMFSGEKLEYLSAWTSAYSPKLFRALTQQGSMPRLRHLSFCIKPADISDLYLFLAQCPNVEHVRVGFTNGRYESNLLSIALAPMPRTALRRLESFSGPEVAAKVFIPGRPVKEVKIRDWNSHSVGLYSKDASLLINSLVLSAVPLRKLDLGFFSCRKELMDLVVSSFPDLYELELCLPPRFKLLFPGDDPRSMEPDAVLAECKGKNQKTASTGCTKRVEKEDVYLASHLTNHLKLLHLVAHKRLGLPSGIQALKLLGPHWSFDWSEVSESDSSSSDDDSSSSDGSTSSDSSSESSSDDSSSTTSSDSDSDDSGSNSSSDSSSDDSSPTSSDDTSSTSSSSDTDSSSSHMYAGSGRIYSRRVFSKNCDKPGTLYSVHMASAVVRALSMNYPALQLVALSDNSGRTLIKWLKDNSGIWTTAQK